MSSSPLIHVATVQGAKKADSYIVQLKPEVDKESFLGHIGRERIDIRVTYSDWVKSILNGFAVTAGPAGLDYLRAQNDVLAIEEDGQCTPFETTVQTNAPWGIARLSQDGPIIGDPNSLNYRYTYDNADASNIDIYIIDTGIRTTHEEFRNGRARWGATFGGYNDNDGHGHGTHVAGTAAGLRFGVEKTAMLVAVKVLSDEGPGNTSDVLAGINYVGQQAIAHPERATIANMSLGAPASNIMDTAVTNLVHLNVNVVVAAGNGNTNAETRSPARAEAVITVGSTNIDDSRRSSSNFGRPLNIFAPGGNIISAGFTSDTAIRVSSGTSMAAPHVAGLIAYYFKRRGFLAPSATKQLLIDTALSGILTGIPADTVNLLARNDQ